MTMLNNSSFAAGRHPAATTLLFGTIGFLCGFLLIAGTIGIQPVRLRRNTVSVSRGRMRCDKARPGAGPFSEFRWCAINVRGGGRRAPQDGPIQSRLRMVPPAAGGRRSRAKPFRPQRRRCQSRILPE